MFNSLTIRGAAGEILWGYRPAARVKAWRIYRHRPDPQHDGKWRLSAMLERHELRSWQTPLLFTAPRAHGFWCWPLIKDSIQVGNGRLIATLGPPEQ